MKFVFENNTWWEVENNRVYNPDGGGYRYLNKNLPIVEADDWNSLDWSCLLDKDSKIGWIAPDGTWFGCDIRNQAKVAERFLKSSEDKLETTGWVKVFRSWLTRSRDWYVKGMVVTKAQAKTLFEKGFIVDDFQIKEE